MNCNNCGENTIGKFCSNCGQKLAVARLSIHELAHETWHAFTHTDKGILRLIKDLLLHPASVYKNYFGGQRKKYFSPVLFFILTAGLVALLYGYVYDYQDKVFETNDEFGKEIYHLTKFRALLLLPFQVVLTWLFVKKRFNFAEITVFWLLALGLTYCIRIVLLPIYFPLINDKLLIDKILNFLVYVVLFWQGLALLGRNVKSVVFMIAVIAITNIVDSTIQLYLLFGDEMFNGHIAGIHSWWDLIIASFKF